MEYRIKIEMNRSGALSKGPVVRLVDDDGNEVLRLPSVLKVTLEQDGKQSKAIIEVMDFSTE